MRRRKRKLPEGLGAPFRRSDGRWVVPYRVAPDTWRQKALPADVKVQRSQEALEGVSAWLVEKRVMGEIQIRAERSGRTVRELSKDWLKLREEDPAFSGV